MSALEEAAIRYVRARVRVLEAAGSDLLVAAIECDAAFHELHVAAGVEMPEDCEDCEADPSLVFPVLGARVITVEDNEGRI